MKEAERDYVNSIKQNTVGNPDNFNRAVKEYESKREEYIDFKGKLRSMFSRNKSKRSRKAVEKAQKKAKEAEKGAVEGGRRRHHWPYPKTSQNVVLKKDRTQKRSYSKTRDP